MPRRAKRGHSSLAQPLTFSPFVRSLATIANVYSSKQGIHEPIAPAGAAGDGDGNCSDQFHIFHPKESDFHGVKLLLQNYLGDKQWDFSGFVNLILGQPTIGRVVKAEDAEDDELFSVVATLNLNRYKDHKCIGQLKEYLMENCQDKGRLGDLTSLLAEPAKDVGLLVSQHVANFPPQLYEGLFDGKGITLLMTRWILCLCSVSVRRFHGRR